METFDIPMKYQAIAGIILVIIIIMVFVVINGDNGNYDDPNIDAGQCSQYECW